MHDNRRNSNCVYLLDSFPSRSETLEADAHLTVLGKIEVYPQQSTDRLSKHCRNSCSGDTHLRGPEQPEYQNRIHDDVDNCTCALSDKDVDGLACALQESLDSNLQEYHDRQPANDTQVCLPVVNNLLVVGLHRHKRLSKKSHDYEQHIRHKAKEDTVFGCRIYLTEALGSEVTRHESTHTNRCAYTKRNHHRLDRKA